MKKNILSLTFTIVLFQWFTSYSNFSDNDEFYKDLASEKILESFQKHLKMETELLTLVNNYRIINNCKKLHLNNNASIEAYNISKAIVSFGELNSISYTKPSIQKATKTEENIAIGFTSAQEAFDYWLQIKQDKLNLGSSNFTNTGISIHEITEGVYIFTLILVEE